MEGSLLSWSRFNISVHFRGTGLQRCFLRISTDLFVCPEKEQRSSCATVVLQPSLCFSPQSSSCRSWHTDVQAFNLAGRLNNRERVQLPQRSVQKYATPGSQAKSHDDIFLLMHACPTTIATYLVYCIQRTHVIRWPRLCEAIAMC